MHCGFETVCKRVDLLHRARKVLQYHALAKFYLPGLQFQEID